MIKLKDNEHIVQIGDYEIKIKESQVIPRGMAVLSSELPDGSTSLVFVKNLGVESDD